MNRGTTKAAPMVRMTSTPISTNRRLSTCPANPRRPVPSVGKPLRRVTRAMACLHGRISALRGPFEGLPHGVVGPERLYVADPEQKEIRQAAAGGAIRQVWHLSSPPALTRPAPRPG